MENGSAAVEAGASSPARTSGIGAILVASGILLSRVLGVARQTLTAKYLGTGGAADALAAALRMPNLLQNLMGEGALSAAFVPVYAGLRARGEHEEAERLTGALAAWLGVAVSLVVLAGIGVAPWFVALVNKGFDAEKRELTVHLVRILFPAAGVLVFSALCLGVLNSHRRFFLAYAAPAAWNLAMIGALLWYGPHHHGEALATRLAHHDGDTLAIKLAWASLAGSLLQLIVQLPLTLSLLGRLRLSFRARSAHFRKTLRSSGPVGVSRGVVQISAYIDLFIASHIDGVLSLMSYTQSISILPVSLFGLAISAAELPELSSQTGTEAPIEKLRERVKVALRRISYFVIPSAVAFVALGGVIVRLLFQRGRFAPTDTPFAWGILAGSAVGLLATTLARLYSSTYFAFHDTRTPLRFALVRVTVAATLGVALAFRGPAVLGIDPRWAGVGLALAGSIAGWIELVLLRRRIEQRIGDTSLGASFGLTVWGSAVLAAAAGLGALQLTRGRGAIVEAVAALGTFGVLYVGLTYWRSLPEAEELVARVLRARR